MKAMNKIIVVKICICLWFLISGTNLIGQSKTVVQGAVTDSTNNPLVAATVVILSSADSSLISFAITDEAGSFYLPDILPGSYELQITYLGYGSFAKVFTIEKDRKVFDFGNLSLEKNSELLQEVVVKAEHVPVSISNDTVLYNAAAFKVRTNDAVEDLLRKLPGIEVSPTGEIKAQGETVNKVLVDGKEFFGNDHKIATRNLPANIVDKVAVFDKKSDESVFTGIQDGQDEKTIDLRLKSDKKVGLFGKLAAGFGVPDRYTAKAQLNSFSSKMQLSFIGNANNINEISFDSDKNQMGLGNAVVVVSSGEADEEEFVNGKNTTLSSGVNFNYDFSKKSRLRSSYFFKSLKNDVLENTKSNFYNADISSLNNETLDSRLKNLGHNVNSAFEVDADSSYQFRMINRVNIADQHNFFLANAKNFNFDGSVFGTSDRKTLNVVDDFGYEGNAILRKRLSKKGRLWSLNMGYNLSSQSKGDTLDNTIVDGNQRFITNQQQNYRSKNYNLGGGFTYTEPLKNDFYLSSYLRLTQDNENISKLFFDISSGQAQNISQLSGLAGLSIVSWRAGSNLTKQTEKYHYQLGISAINMNFAFNDDETKTSKSKFFFLLPQFSFNKSDKNSSILLRYTGSVKEPSVSQMATLIDNINPLFIYTGNKNLQPAYAHSLNLFFHKYDSFYFRNQMANFNVSYVRNSITNARQTDEFFVTRVFPINVKYEFSALGRYSYSSPFFIPKTKITATTEMQFYNGLTSINGLEVVNNRYISGLNFLLENKKKDALDWSLSYGYDFTYSNYQTKVAQNLSYASQMMKLHTAIYANEDITFGTDLTFRTYSNEQISTQNALKFWNVFLDIDLGKKKRWTASLSVNDLLNQGLGIFRNATPLALIERSSSNLGRYGMVTLSYALSDFKPQK